MVIKTEKILSEFLLETILDISKILIEKSLVQEGKSKLYEKFLQVSLYRRILDFKNKDKNWTNIDIEKVYPETPKDEADKNCDLFFEELSTSIDEDTDKNQIIYELIKKPIWIELKFLTPTGNTKTVGNVSDMIKDFLRLYYYTGKNTHQDNNTELYFIMLILCGRNEKKKSNWDPRTYFGIKILKNFNKYLQIKNLIYPSEQKEIEFNFKEFLLETEDVKVSGFIDLKVNRFPEAKNIDKINISRYFIGPCIFKQDTKFEELENKIFGYLFKLEFNKK